MDSILTRIIREQNRDLLERIAKAYSIPEQELRQGYLQPTYYQVVRREETPQKNRNKAEAGKATVDRDAKQD